MDTGVQEHAQMSMGTYQTIAESERPNGQSDLRLFESHHDVDIRREERCRIARDLHDSTSQLLVSLQLKVASLRETLKDAEHDSVLTELDTILHDLHNEVRSVSASDLAPQIPPEQLPSALKSMAEQFARRANIEVTVIVEGEYTSRPLSLEYSMYRIAQEALANVQRHAHASAARLRLKSSNSSLTLVVEDDGFGYQPRGGANRANQGVGLRNIRERVREYNGRMSFRRLNSGSRLSVVVHC